MAAMVPAEPSESKMSVFALELRCEDDGKSTSGEKGSIHEHRKAASDIQYTIYLISPHISHIVSIFTSKPQILLTLNPKYRPHSEILKGLLWDDCKSAHTRKTAVAGDYRTIFTENWAKTSRKCTNFYQI
jgi:hypothetical protein